MRNLLFSKQAKLHGLNSMRSRYALFNPHAAQIFAAIKMIEGLVKDQATQDQQAQELAQKIEKTDQMILKIKSANSAEIYNLVEEILKNLTEIKNKLLDIKPTATSSSVSKVVPNQSIIENPEYISNILKPYIIAKKSAEVDASIAELTKKIMQQARKRNAKLALQNSSRPARPGF